MPVTRAALVEAALAVLDEAGLDGLTLRAVAARLGVRAPTLYWHVKDKNELLDLVAAGIMAQVATPAAPAHGQPWWDWLADRARAHYAGILAHRDGARVLAGNRPTEESWPDIEATLARLAEAGVPPLDGLRMLLVIGSYVLGAALEREAARTRLAGPSPEAVAPARDPGRYPHIVSAFRELGARLGPAYGTSAGSVLAEDLLFDHGLRRLVDGLRIGQEARVTSDTAAGGEHERIVRDRVSQIGPDREQIPGAGRSGPERVAGSGPPDLERIPGSGPPPAERIGDDDPGGVRGGRSG